MDATPPAAVDIAAEPVVKPGLPFPVVGIGASAGGLSALESFFAAMPREEAIGMAFVVVQHLSPDHKSLLAELVGRYTRMQVVEAADGMRIEPNRVYIIAPGRDLAVHMGALQLTEHASRGPHLTIDHFFRSLAEEQGERAICIVLSGTGSDGTLGLRAVKGDGGLAIVQSPDSAEYDGMPRSAIGTNLVDFVLPPSDMPAQLMAYARHAFDPDRPRGAPVRDGFLKKICLLLRAQTGHDFAQYKETTLVRRIDRRMALRQIERSEDYLRYARENPPELEALFRDLLIGVTNFFRDPEAFAALEQRVIPRILDDKSVHEAVRVWVCGCSTGEEAYSIAILLYEYANKTRKPFKIQVFATDIDHQAIEQARTGVYPASIAADISDERLTRFFTHDPQRGTYRIQKNIRDLLVFSEQDVIKDPPFSKLDLISCRNLLIYLNAEVQRKLIPLFQYALVPGGALFLGTSETVGESARLFSPIDRKWKLYVRAPNEPGVPRPPLADFVPPLFDAGERRPPPAIVPGDSEPGSLRYITEQALLAHYAQAGVLINGRGQILHIVGRTGKFLEPADGDAAMNILPMAREGLRRELTIALHRAVAHRQPVSYPNLRVKANGDYINANLIVRPVEIGSGMAAHTAFLVVLEEAPEVRGMPEATLAAGDSNAFNRIASLEQELRSKDEYLQTTLEEMETTNEELKSTNEELETSKEELQSVNEELSTVNAELQDKVADLSRANNDMNNLLAGTGVGTVFVDHDLRIARFTPAATQVINLITSDIGRPLEHVASNIIGHDGLAGDIRRVLDTLVPHESEVQVKSGAWYLMRIRPYRTMENHIEGAVVTLVDISERRKTEESLRRSESRLNAFINQAYAGVAQVDGDGQFVFVNDRFCDMLGYGREELLQRRQRDITDPEDLPRAFGQHGALAQGGPDFHIDKRYVRKNGARIWVHERVSAIRDGRERPTSFLALAFELPSRQA